MTTQVFGDLVSVQVTSTTPSKVGVVVCRLWPEEVVLCDEINLRSEVSRERLVERLPEDLQPEARALLLDVAAHLCQGELQPSAEGRGPIGGSELLLPEPAVADEPVEGARLLDEIAATLTMYLVLPEGAAAAITLWIVATFVYAVFPVSPILAIVSPEKRCGKTTLLTLLSALVARAVPGSSITPASLFRVVEKCQPTLLIDEADSFLGEREELRGILNSGHSKATAFVIRTVGEDHDPRRFHTFCPKAVAAIGTLPETILDRSIVIRMRRRAPDEQVARFRSDRPPENLARLVSQAARWTRDQADELGALDPEVPAELNDRQADSWRPLFAIADLAGGKWPRLAREAARLLCGGALDDAGPAVELLADLRTLFRDRGEERLRTTDIIDHLTSLDDRPWSSWGRVHPITPNQLARLLRRFGIKPKAFRLPDVPVFKGYSVDQFADSWSRYLPSEPLQELHGTGTEASTANPAHGITALESRISYGALGDVTAVTDRLPPRAWNSVAAAEASPVTSYPCTGCGRFRFPTPGALCLWCR